MKRAELKVGQVVESKRGNTYRVVDTGGWRNWGGHRLDATGVEYSGIPVVSAASPVPATGRVGVLVVPESEIAAVRRDGVKTVGGRVQGEPMMPQNLYPAGTYAANIKAGREAAEARVEADEKRDRELIEMVQSHWGDVPHLIATCGVVIDDGLLTERERQVLITMILCGQNRNR